MKYEEILPHLKDRKKIIVTGPQRSGTRIAAKIIASDLDVEYIDEWLFGCYIFSDMIKEASKRDSFVIQAPSLSAFITDMPDDFTIVYMMRDLEDIENSEKRCGWTKAQFERGIAAGRHKFCEGINWDATSSIIKYALLKRQIREIKEGSLICLDYDSLSNHDLWVKKEDRKKFAMSHTSVDDVKHVEGVTKCSIGGCNEFSHTIGSVGINLNDKLGERKILLCKKHIKELSAVDGELDGSDIKLKREVI